MLSTPTEISLLLTWIASSLIAVITFRDEVSKKAIGRTWVIFNVLVATWALCWFLGAFFFDLDKTRWLAMYFANFAAILLPPLFLDFVENYLSTRKTHRWLLRMSWLSSLVLFVGALVWPRHFVAGMQKIGAAYLPVAGSLLWLFALQYAVLVAAGIWLLLRELKTQRGAERNKSLYIIIGCGIGFLGGATTFPPALGIVRTYPYGVILIPIYSVIITYAILHDGLMDIRLVLRDTTMHVATASLLGVSCAIVALPVVSLNPFLAVVFSIIVMGFLMAVAYDPLRRVLQPTLDRIIFANQFGYLEELAQLPNDMLEFTNLGEMLTFLLTRLKEAARLERVRILMYDPGHQSYEETVIRSENEKSNLDQAAHLPESAGLIQFLKDDRGLCTADDLERLNDFKASEALSELKSLHGAACFPVCKENNVVGVVILGPKRSKETFNQQDMKILRALRMRLENFFAQAMTITQEALNMVKDSHDMKNDVNVLKGRVTWRAMRIAGWKIEFEKYMKSLGEWLAMEEAKGAQGQEHERVKQTVAGMRTQALEWFAEAEKSRTVEEQTIQRLSHRLRNWAEYGRVVSEGFRGQRQMEAIDVAGAVRIAVERWKPIAERKTLALSASTPAGLAIWGERSLLEQIIENLIDNAVKATVEGSVQVTCRKDGHHVMIEVRDSGCGIPAEDIGTIFEKPFYQGKGRESLEQSTGVGLYLVAQYAKSLGGKVSADSQVGKGSTFRVALPLYKEEVKKAGVAA